MFCFIRFISHTGNWTWIDYLTQTRFQPREIKSLNNASVSNWTAGILAYFVCVRKETTWIAWRECYNGNESKVKNDSLAHFWTQTKCARLNKYRWLSIFYPFKFFLFGIRNSIKQTILHVTWLCVVYFIFFFHNYLSNKNKWT